jgi:nucleotide-binding universal stress UspA family protein
MEALRRAIDLARPFKATLTLVHVIDFPGYVYSAVPFADVDLFAQFESAARAQLDEAFRRVSLEYPHARAVMRPHGGRGVPAEILLAIASVGADLVVMGTHGRHGIARALLGSVAEKVVRLSPVPVLTVHAAEEAVAQRDASRELSAGAGDGL